MAESEVAKQIKEAVEQVDAAVGAVMTASATLKNLAEKLMKKGQDAQET